MLIRLLMVAILALGLGTAAWWALRRRSSAPAPAPGPIDPSQLLDALAELDARYAGREADTPPDEWSAYQERRASLKAQLASALAGR